MSKRYIIDVDDNNDMYTDYDMYKSSRYILPADGSNLVYLPGVLFKAAIVAIVLFILFG